VLLLLLLLVVLALCSAAAPRTSRSATGVQQLPKASKAGPSELEKIRSLSMFTD
jgi:hypothetical protein